MSKHKADAPQQHFWRGHPLYVSPDGRFSTTDKERFDQYMAAQEREQALRARMDARRSGPQAETPSEGSETTDQGVTTDAATDVDENEQPAHKSNRRRRGDDDGR